MHRSLVPWLSVVLLGAGARASSGDEREGTELLVQRLRCAACAGNDENARRVAVEPVNKPGLFALLVAPGFQHVVDMAIDARTALHCQTRRDRPRQIDRQGPEQSVFRRELHDDARNHG